MQGYPSHPDPYGHPDQGYPAGLHAPHPGHPLHHQQPPSPLYPTQQQQHSPRNLYNLGGEQQQQPQEIEGAAAGTRKRKAAAMMGSNSGGGAGSSNGADSGGAGGANKRREGSAGGGAGDDDDEKPQGDAKKSNGSEFVRKLYTILDEGKFNAIVSWGIDGTSFVVHDMNQFTTTILPQHFKHSNFASFVRQLNKYDFHKVKSTEDSPSPYGDNVWQFRHPEFRAGHGDNLDAIKRKPPSSKKAAAAKAQADAAAAAASAASAYGSSLNQPYPSPHGNGPPGLPNGPPMYGAPPGSVGGLGMGGGGGGGGPNGAEWSNVLAQLDSLSRTQAAMQQHMSNLSADYQAVIGEMINFQRNMVAQDQLMQNMIQYLVSLEADQRGATSTQDSSAPYVPSSQAQKLISSYTEVARASYDQMADLTRRASLSGASFSNMPPLPPAPPSFDQFEFAPLRDGPNPPNGAQQSQQHHPPPQQQQQQGHGPGPSPYDPAPPPPPPSSSTVGQQKGGRADQNAQQSSQRTSGSSRPPPVAQYIHPAYANDPSYSHLAHQPQQQHHHQDHTPQQMHNPTGRRESAVPGWAVPPRVLLVEDDTVCRKLSSKFLEKFGCQIDVAVDGVSAVNKMNVQKYDLVLMDIMMPNLDGVSATSLIRQFDPMTPIISMTSNSGPNDIMTYFSHGMNDVLPKPFTKENLLSMLEKHLVHLKLMQQMAEIPRALGFTDHQIQDALAQAVVISDEDGSGSESGQGQQVNGTSSSASATNNNSSGVLNPFSSFGLSDQDYVGMLQGIAMEKEGKRELEVVRGDGTVRFQEVVQ
ncbi:hypothetical protein JCM10908_000831 [Rhodotorula pacifica]|uniref:uncharacterized protein n=1 Tax=Rhodotorula pacifica TaxID=1495444 RepID=UPI00316BB589